MKILIISIALVFITLAPLDLKSQNFYLSVGSGYGVAMNQEIGTLQNEKQVTILELGGSNSYNTTYENVPLSLGKGFNFGGSVGYTFSDYLAVDLGVSYLIGGKTTGENISHRTEVLPGSTLIYETTSSRTLYSNMFRLMPTFVINPHFEKLNPYLKMGVAFGFGKMYSDYEYSSSSTNPVGPSPFVESSKEEFTGGMAFGITTAIGVRYPVTEKLSVYLEANYMGMSYTPNKSSVIEFTQNGQDNLDQMPIYSQQTEYLNSYTEENLPIDYDQPRKTLKNSLPYSSMNFNFGVVFNLKKS
jgi:hypothetical protein